MDGIVCISVQNHEILCHMLTISIMQNIVGEITKQLQWPSPVNINVSLNSIVHTSPLICLVMQKIEQVAWIRTYQSIASEHTLRKELGYPPSQGCILHTGHCLFR